MNKVMNMQREQQNLYLVAWDSGRASRTAYDKSYGKTSTNQVIGEKKSISCYLLFNVQQNMFECLFILEITFLTLQHVVSTMPLL